MIESLRAEYGFLIICDTCSFYQKYCPESGRNWQEFIAAARNDGWRFQQKEGEWEHYCPDCVAKFAKRRNE